MPWTRKIAPNSKCTQPGLLPLVNLGEGVRELIKPPGKRNGEPRVVHAARAGFSALVVRAMPDIGLMLAILITGFKKLYVEQNPSRFP